MASVQLKHFTIRAIGDEVAEESVNRFLRGHSVLDVRQEFVPNGTNSVWCIAVRYAERDDGDGSGGRRPRIDYREVLDPEVFARFAELRKRRRAIAEADALPPFAVFTDEELAAIARFAMPSFDDLRTVKGIGEKKAERFGRRLLGLDEGPKDETGDRLV